jgi:dolichol-phosphate mannosyltransferase
MRLYFLIPVYNESANLDLLAEDLLGSLPAESKFYLFVDDASSDDTVTKIETLFRSTHYHVITKEQNRGPGDAFNLGFEWILKESDNESDIIITMEADNTSDISLLPKMVNISALDYDLVLASVYAQGGGFQKSSFIRKVISFSANMFLRFAFNIKIQTLSSFYRVYRINLIKRIKQNYNTIISEKGFVCMFEILLKAVRLNATIIEIPMVLKSLNRKDRSKMKVLRTIAHYIRYIASKKT